MLLLVWRFCSGVVVSPDGLVFTNHHCGYDAIQQHSSVEHDYLRDGFVADSLSKELPNPDLFVSFLIRTEDVTERVLQAIPVGTKENDRALIVDSISTLLAQEAVANDTLLRAEITPFMVVMSFICLCIKIIMMFVWCLLLPLL